MLGRVKGGSPSLSLLCFPLFWEEPCTQYWHLVASWFNAGISLIASVAAPFSWVSLMMFSLCFNTEDVDWKRRKGHQQDCSGGWPGPDERFPV